MAGKGRSGQAWKNGYSNYKVSARYQKNRARDIQHHIDENPNDKVAVKALGNIKYRRKAPGKKQGWVNGKVMAIMESYVGLNSNPCIPPQLRSVTSFSGMYTKRIQQKMAQYMKMTRKTENEMRYTPKKVAKK